MKKHKKHLRKWVRVTLSVIGFLLLTALMIYTIIGGVLQSSYRYHAPTDVEIAEAQEGGPWSWITLAKY